MQQCPRAGNVLLFFPGFHRNRQSPVLSILTQKSAHPIPDSLVVKHGGIQPQCRPQERQDRLSALSWAGGGDAETHSKLKLQSNWSGEQLFWEAKNKD